MSKLIYPFNFPSLVADKAVADALAEGLVKSSDNIWLHRLIELAIKEEMDMDITEAEEKELAGLEKKMDEQTADELSGIIALASVSVLAGNMPTQVGPRQEAADPVNPRATRYDMVDQVLVAFWEGSPVDGISLENARRYSNLLLRELDSRLSAAEEIELKSLRGNLGNGVLDLENIIVNIYARLVKEGLGMGASADLKSNKNIMAEGVELIVQQISRKR